MDALASYLLLLLPESSYSSSEALAAYLSANAGVPTAVTLPDFRIGTLDQLVGQVEELGKLDAVLTGSVGKVLDVFQLLYPGRAANEHKKVGGSEVTSYLKKFRWNTTKYRLDKPVLELMATIASELAATDGDLRAAYSQYQAAKNGLALAARKQLGDLTVRSLHDIVTASDFVDSEYLTSVLVVVPKSAKSAFLAEYELLAQFVVPRLARELSSDAEFSLYVVTVFKKFANEFTLKLREKKYTPREFDYSEEAVIAARSEYNEAGLKEKNVRRDLARLASAAYGDLVSAWWHVKALRVYCESVLRYGLPPQFYVYLVEVKDAEKSKKVLVEQFGYLGGNAFAKDSKGRVVQGELGEYAGLVDVDYEPFVVYRVDVY